jgi:hypothetical protein
MLTVKFLGPSSLRGVKMTIWLRTTLCICGMLPLLTSLPAPGQQVPNGSYLKSCGQFHMNGAMLTASCATGGNPGAFVSTIDTSACGSDISNKAGALFCLAKPGTWGVGRAVPRGSYLESCGDASVKGTVLFANCTNRNGISTIPRLNLASCRMGNNITNVDGQLVCIR